MAPKPGLDREKVVAAAVRIIDQEGYEALTLNRLAEEMQVKPPSLYNHIDGLPGLKRELALLSARRLRETFTEALVGKSGPEAVRALAQAYRHFVKSSPGLYQAGIRSSAYQSDPELDEEQTHAVQLVGAVIASFGLKGNDAIHAVRGLRSLVHGFVSLEIAGGFGLPVDCDESFSVLIDYFITGLRSRAAVGSSLIKE
jgi:AcrR family transcriptional regulator